MAVQAGELAPDGPQVERAGRHRDVHDRFHRLAVGLAVDKAADAADALGDIDKLDVVLLLDELLQAAMDEANGRAGLDYLFVFDHQIKVDRLRQHRMLRAEGDDSAGHGLGISYWRLVAPWLRASAGQRVRAPLRARALRPALWCSRMETSPSSHRD